VPALFSAMPTFWLGIVALQILSFRLGLMSIFPDGSLLAFVVPAVVLGIPLSAPFTQVLLKSVDATYAQPFVDVARAKGGRPAHVFFHHVSRNAAAPALTMVGLAAGQLLAGTVVTETVFSRTGIGKVLEEAVSRQDVALVQGFVLLSALVFVVINLTVDLVYPLLDPRIAGIRRRRTGAPNAPVVPAAD
jgi:peptide/nickel transport system permease protein